MNMTTTRLARLLAPTVTLGMFEYILFGNVLYGDDKITDFFITKTLRPRVTTIVNIKEASQVDLSYCVNLEDLGSLTKVEELDVWGCRSLKTLGKLTTVSKDLVIVDCTSLISLGNLESVRSITADDRTNGKVMDDAFNRKFSVNFI